jgi:hypothetical protein
MGRNYKVTERTESGRSVGKSARSYAARSGRLLVVAVTACIMLGGAVAGYLFGRQLASHPLADATKLIQQLQPENQRLKTTILDQNSKLVALQAKLTKVQAALEAIMPSKNTYQIFPNQSMIVGGGRLTVGLIGPPTNERVNININGQQHSAATGDIFKIMPDPATTCEVSVRGFDMFEVMFTASCAAAKPQ